MTCHVGGYGEDAEMDRLVKQLDLPAIATKYLSLAREDAERGNLQVNFGYASGNNIDGSEEVVAENYASRPRMLEGTMDESSRRLFPILMKIARQAGAKWAQKGYGQDDPVFLRMNKEFGNKIENNNIMQLVSIAMNYLDTPSLSQDTMMAMIVMCIETTVKLAKSLRWKADLCG